MNRFYVNVDNMRNELANSKRMDLERGVPGPGQEILGSELEVLGPDREALGTGLEVLGPEQRPLEETNDSLILEGRSELTSGKERQKPGEDVIQDAGDRLSESESRVENEDDETDLADGMISNSATMRRKQGSESGVKLRKVEKSVGVDENATTQGHIFTERPFFQRLTDSIYRRLIIGSSNQIKLVGLISAARLLVHLYECNTLEVPQNEQVKYHIPLLNCHVGDWQPVDSDKVVLASSNLSKDILGCSKAPHAPPLVNRTRNIYIVTPLNYDGNKVGGGYRGGGSDPLSRLVMKWRNLSVSDIQDFTYITENGFDLKYNGFYILFAKSNKPGSQWKQFYSARMRTNAFNSRHQILINSTHLSKLIKLHTVHLQKDGTDLPIGMALFEDHTESLTTEEIRKDYSTQSANDLNNMGSNEHKASKGHERNSRNNQGTEDFGSNLVDPSRDTQSFHGAASYMSQAYNQVSNDMHITSNQENGQALGNSIVNGVVGGNIMVSSGQVIDQISYSQSNTSNTSVNSMFARDSLELSLLFNFRSLNPRLQTEILHALSCIKFLNQDVFSVVLRSALDITSANSSFSENGAVSPTILALMQTASNAQNIFEKAKSELPMFVRLLQDCNTENTLNSGYNSLNQESFMPSNEHNKQPTFNGYASMDNMNVGLPSNSGNSMLPMFWSSILNNQFNHTNSFVADQNSSNINTLDISNSSTTVDLSMNDTDNQNEANTS